MKKSFEITAVVVTGSTYAPKMEDCKDYDYTVFADSPEEAEESVRKMIEKDKTRFIPLEQRIRFLNVKRTDGGAVVYKDDNQVYRRFARALRKYRMWPYLERCKEACVDFCCYSGVDVEIAAAQFAKEQDVRHSIARDFRGDELTAMQQMRAEVIRQNGIRIQRINQPVNTNKPETINNGPLYPDAGAERYHEMSPEVTKELAKQSKPEKVLVQASQENTLTSLVKTPVTNVINPRIKISFQIITKDGKEAQITRFISVSKRDDGLISGLVFNPEGKYTGSWFWNKKQYNYPVFKNIDKQRFFMGQNTNINQLLVSIKEAIGK